jgi:hypothetical protein
MNTEDLLGELGPQTPNLWQGRVAIARRANDIVRGSDRLSDGTNLKKVCSNGSSASSVTVELPPKLHFAENVASDI